MHLAHLGHGLVAETERHAETAQYLQEPVVVVYKVDHAVGGLVIVGHRRYRIMRFRLRKYEILCFPVAQP